MTRTTRSWSLYGEMGGWRRSAKEKMRKKMRKTRKSRRLRKWLGRINTKIEEDEEDMEMDVVDDGGKMMKVIAKI